MTIITDLDLLLLEPSIFIDANSAALLVASGNDATIVNAALTSAGADFSESNVGAGNVVIVNNEPLEVIVSTSKTSLNVTRLREPGVPPVNPGDGTGLVYNIYTFNKAIQEAEQWLLRVLGVDPNHPTQPLTSQNILNYGEFSPLIALRTITVAFARASALDPADLSLHDRAELYERLEGEMRQHLIASIDSDGDGVVDERRRLAIGTWIRI